MPLMIVWLQSVKNNETNFLDCYFSKKKQQQKKNVNITETVRKWPYFGPWQSGHWGQDGGTGYRKQKLNRVFGDLKILPRTHFLASQEEEASEKMGMYGHPTRQKTKQNIM